MLQPFEPWLFPRNHHLQGIVQVCFLHPDPCSNLGSSSRHVHLQGGILKGPALKDLDLGPEAMHSKPAAFPQVFVLRLFVFEVLKRRLRGKAQIASKANDLLWAP